MNLIVVRIRRFTLSCIPRTRNFACV